jgi:DNA-binding transcriptional MerR regulator
MARGVKVFLTVGEVARILGCCTKTLRNWDRAGTFRAQRHPINGYRVYQSKDVLRLRRKLVDS